MVTRLAMLLVQKFLKKHNGRLDDSSLGNAALRTRCVWCQRRAPGRRAPRTCAVTRAHPREEPGSERRCGSNPSSASLG